MRNKNNKWSRREKKYGRNAKHRMRVHGRSMKTLLAIEEAKRQRENKEEENDS